MSDDWADVIDEPKKKSRVPKWLMWTCGIGCLLMILTGVVAGVGGWFLWQKANDPAEVHPRLMKVLQTEEWPEGYRGRGISLFDEGSYMVQWPGGIVMLQTMSSSASIDQLMDPDSSANLLASDPVTGTLSIQGRPVPSLTFSQWPAGEHLRVDVSGDEPPYFVIDLIAEERSQLDAAQIEEFLTPFDVWIGED